MSSESQLTTALLRASRWLAVASFVAAVGCAGFRRGEYWEQDTEAGDAADGAQADAGDGDGSGETSASAGETETTADGSTTGAAAGLSFQRDVLPLLRTGCERCHSADGSAADTDFILSADDQANYDMTLTFVDLDFPESSRLLTKTAGKGHNGGVVFDDRSEQYETILTWIEQGAMP